MSMDSTTTKMYLCQQILIQIIPQDILKKYIMYAKSGKGPIISEIDREKVALFYVDARKEAKVE